MLYLKEKIYIEHGYNIDPSYDKFNKRVFK